MTTMADKQRVNKIQSSLQKLKDQYPDDQHRILQYTPGIHGTCPAKLKLVCLCGQVEEVEWRARRSRHGLICTACMQRQGALEWIAAGIQKTSNPRYSLEFVQALFLERGATPTFTHYSGPHKPLTFLCACGQPGSITFRNLYYVDSRCGAVTLPRCPTCHKAFKQQIGREKAAQYLTPHPTGPDHPLWNPDLIRFWGQATVDKWA